MIPPRIERGFNVFVVVLAAMLPVIFFELLGDTPLAPSRLRRLFVEHQRKYEYSLVDPEMGYRPRVPYRLSIKEPGLRLEFTHEPMPLETSWGYRANSTGAKHEGRAEIVVLGDSNTYGALVSDSETWVSRLEALSGLRVINLGVDGYGTSQEAALYRRHGRVFQPRIVLIQLCFNDPWDNLFYRDWRVGQAGKGVVLSEYLLRRKTTSPALSYRCVRFVARRSLLAHRLLLRWFSSELGRRNREDPGELARGMLMLLDDLAGLNEELSLQGRSFAVIINDDWTTTLPEQRAELRAFLARKRITFLDLGEMSLWGYMDRELKIWGDGHWNERGHAVVAAETYRFLRRNGLIARRTGLPLFKP